MRGEEKRREASKLFPRQERERGRWKEGAAGVESLAKWRPTEKDEKWREFGLARSLPRSLGRSSLAQQPCGAKKAVSVGGFLRLRPRLPLPTQRSLRTRMAARKNGERRLILPPHPPCAAAAHACTFGIRESEPGLSPCPASRIYEAGKIFSPSRSLARSSGGIRKRRGLRLIIIAQLVRPICMTKNLSQEV